MHEVALKDVFRNVQVVESERNPTIVTFLYTSNDAGDYASNKWAVPSLGVFVPGSEKVSDLNGIEQPAPIYIDKSREQEPKRKGI
jgi:hypothetical protein